MRNALILFILIFSISFIYAVEDKLEKQEKASNKELTGFIYGKTGGWSIDLEYDKDMKIKGDFYKDALVTLPVDTYTLDITINKLKYKGRITYKKPFLAAPYYSVDMSLNKKALKGDIKISYKKTFRKDLFDLELESKEADKILSGFIEYTRKDYAPVISMEFDDGVKISGFQVVKSKYLRSYSFRMGEKKIIGTINLKRPNYELIFNTTDLTEDEIFYFLFFEAYFLIDEEIRTPDKNSSFYNEDQNF